MRLSFYWHCPVHVSCNWTSLHQFSQIIIHVQLHSNRNASSWTPSQYYRPSYRYRDSHVKDKDVSSIIFNMKSPSLWQLPEDVLHVSEWDEYKFSEVGPGHAIYSRKSSLDAGGFTEESGIVLMHCLAAPRRSCCHYASTYESGSIRQLSLQSKFLPSFRERYSPPNPESASIGRNLGWRNFQLPLTILNQRNFSWSSLGTLCQQPLFLSLCAEPP